MNSKKCKQLRKMIYGDLSQKTERSYVTIGHTVSRFITGKDGKPKQVNVVANQTANNPKSPRAMYLAAKRQYKARKRGGYSVLQNKEGGKCSINLK